MPVTFLMFFISLLPQNWAMYVIVPPVNPKRIIQNTKKNWVARPTVASSVSPSLPTMMVSIKFKDEEIRLWSAIGIATCTSFFLRICLLDFIALLFLSIDAILSYAWIKVTISAIRLPALLHRESLIIGFSSVLILFRKRTLINHRDCKCLFISVNTCNYCKYLLLTI